ncbi:MAG: sigma-70 family RNA polymerase sigma factor [Acidimicrobiia bacterium]|nr:sigma-70 family RNA polymerase sigma factor [Acidimicrobiia bacterium]
MTLLSPVARVTPVGGAAGPDAPERTPSFEAFHTARAAATLRYARTLLDPHGAEDACQEAWLRAWRAWGSADQARLDAWVRAIVRNCCLDVLSRRRGTTPVGEGDLPAVSAAEDEALRGIDLAALRTRFLRLPPALRETLWLREIGQLSYAEIASRQQVPVGTVMSRLHAARTRARRLRLAG